MAQLNEIAITKQDLHNSACKVNKILIIGKLCCVDSTIAAFCTFNCFVFVALYTLIQLGSKINH
jgi:hypothetical protein